MQPIVFCYPTLAVSVVYCLWQAYMRVRIRREQVLRERVAYLLWVMASRLGGEGCPSQTAG
jgi:hypothetical protein